MTGPLLAKLLEFNLPYWSPWQSAELFEQEMAISEYQKDKVVVFLDSLPTPPEQYSHPHSPHHPQ